MILQVGTYSAEVGNWQRFLNDQHVSATLLVEDEAFGPKTRLVTLQWQVANNLRQTGLVSDLDRVIAAEQGFIPFIQAKNCNIIWPEKRTPIDLIVIHTMENAEKPTAAENVALWFAGRGPSPSPLASAHFCIDPANTIQCVRETDVAWHAPGANNNGIGIEHAGYAKQTPADWADEASKTILERSAQLAAKLAMRFDIPVTHLSVGEVQDKMRGFVGHVDITNAFPGPGRTHSDPGQSFPWVWYLERVQAYITR